MTAAYTFCQEHVRRLKVPVQNPLSVEVLDGGHHLLHVRLDLVLAQHPDLTGPKRDAVQKGTDTRTITKLSTRDTQVSYQ